MTEPVGSYRVRFQGRPELDSESFRDYTGRVAEGQEMTFEGETWRIAEVVPGDEDERDILVFERAVD
jgi:hypothetical protein